jgi:hypothetical protein
MHILAPEIDADVNDVLNLSFMLAHGADSISFQADAHDSAKLKQALSNEPLQDVYHLPCWSKLATRLPKLASYKISLISW